MKDIELLIDRLHAHADAHEYIANADEDQRQWMNDLYDAADEIERLMSALITANDQTEHFERLWYLAKEDADRYAFAKTMEGQIVTMRIFRGYGAAELDQALDDAMAEDHASAAGRTGELNELERSGTFRGNPTGGC